MAPVYTSFPYIKKSVRNRFYPVIREQEEWKSNCKEKEVGLIRLLIRLLMRLEKEKNKETCNMERGTVENTETKFDVNQIRLLIQEKKDEIKEKFKAEVVEIFGSYA